MALPASLIKTWSDLQLNFDALAKIPAASLLSSLLTRVPAGYSIQSFVMAGASLNIPNIDGQSITGVRLSFAGSMNSAGAALVLRPNGLTPINTNGVSHRHYYDGAAMGTDVIFGAAIAAGTGMGICWQDFSAGNDVHGHGFFSTRTGFRRLYSGFYVNTDTVTNVNRLLEGKLVNRWEDTTTAITSLTIATTAGTFTGRVTVETIP